MENKNLILIELINNFKANIKQYKSPIYDEANTRVDYIDKFFELFLWKNGWKNYWEKITYIIIIQLLKENQFQKIIMVMALLNIHIYIDTYNCRSSSS